MIKGHITILPLKGGHMSSRTSNSNENVTKEYMQKDIIEFFVESIDFPKSSGK